MSVNLLDVERKGKPPRVLTATSEPGVYTAVSASNPRIVYRITGVGTPFVVCPCPASQLDRDCWHRAEALRIGGFNSYASPPQTESKESEEDMGKQTETAVSTWVDYEWEDDGTEDIAPAFPYIKIVQATSGMAGASRHAGEFYHSDTEAYSPHLDVVALVKRNTRALFEKDADQPSCSSPDGFVPFENTPLWDKKEVVFQEGPMLVPHDRPVGCGGCQFSQWVEGKPPACKLSMALLVDRSEKNDGSDLAMLRVGGKSLKPFRQFVAKNVVAKRRPLYSYNLTLTTQEFSEPGKKWFELRIAPSDLALDQAKAYNALVKEQRGKFEANAAMDHLDQDEAPSAMVDEWGDGSESYATNTPTHSTLSEPAPLT